MKLEAGDGDDAQASESDLTQWSRPVTADVPPTQFTGSWPAFGFSDVAMQRSHGRLDCSQASLITPITATWPCAPGSQSACHADAAPPGPPLQSTPSTLDSVSTPVSRGLASPARHGSHQVGDGDDAQASECDLTQWSRPVTADVPPTQFTGSWPAFGFPDVATQRSHGRLDCSQASLITPITATWPCAPGSQSAWRADAAPPGPPLQSTPPAQSADAVLLRPDRVTHYRYEGPAGPNTFSSARPLSPEEIFQSAGWTGRLAFAYNERGLVPRSEPYHGTGLWLQGDTVPLQPDRRTQYTAGSRTFAAARPLSPGEIFRLAGWSGRLAYAYNERGLVPRSSPYYGRGLWLQPQPDGSEAYGPARNTLHGPRAGWR